MRTRPRWLMLLAAAALALAATASANARGVAHHRHAPRITAKVVGLGAPHGFVIFDAAGINDAGQIVGTARTAFSDGDARAYSWQNGRFHDLGALAGASVSSASAQAGKFIVGTALSSSGEGLAVRFTRGHAVAYPSLTGAVSTTATDVNSRGVVVGYSFVDGGTHATIWRHGKPRDLGLLPGGLQSVASSIDEHDNVVGWAAVSSGLRRAVIWRHGAPGPVELRRRSGWGETVANRIGADGGIVGIAEVRPHAFHGVMWTHARPSDLGTLPGQNSSFAAGINRHDVIVGSSQDAGHTTGGAVRWIHGHIEDLNRLLPRRTTWKLLLAGDVNDRGEIIGYGIHAGAPEAFLLTIKSR